MTRKKGIKPKQSDPKKLSEDDLKYLKEKTDFDEKDIDEWFEEFIKVKVLSFSKHLWLTVILGMSFWGSNKAQGGRSNTFIQTYKYSCIADFSDL